MPEKSTAFKLAVYYRLVASASFLVGGIIILAGLWLGLADAVDVLLEEFLEPDMVSDALVAADPLVTAAFVVVGATVWQVGKAAALHWTLAAAIETDAPADTEPSTTRTGAEAEAEQATRDDRTPPRKSSLGTDAEGDADRTTAGGSLGADERNEPAEQSVGVSERPREDGPSPGDGRTDDGDRSERGRGRDGETGSDTGG